MDELAPGLQEVQNLTDAGFDENEIGQWREETTRTLQDAGFNSEETAAYFGEKTPDLSKTKATFESNLAAKRAANAPVETTVAATGEKEPEGGKEGQSPKLRQAETFIESIEAGFDMSVTGLIKGRPDVVMPENAPMFYRIASQVGTLAGDVPWMLAGGVIGAPVGAAAGSFAVPVLGTAAGAVVGAGAGSFAVPEGMRTALMEHYEKGDVKSFGDFWERASAVAINTLKGAAIGGVTAGVGGVVAKGAVKVAAPAIAKTVAQLTAEVATMTSVGAALEGHMPQPQEFLDAAILVGGLHGAIKVGTKTREIYSKTGMKPTEVFEKASQDSHFKQQMLADNVPVPQGSVPMSGELGARPEPLKPPETFETVKKFKEPNPELSESTNAILSKVGEKGDKPKKAMTFDKVYTNLVDKLDPINQATKILNENKAALPADKNPYVLARTAVDAPAKAKHFFENGSLDFTTLEKSGPSLREALKSVESPDVLDAYMISKRVVEKNAQGLKTGFDVEAAKKVVAEHGPKYEAAAKKVTEFSNSVLDYVEQAGVLSKEATARMKESNKDYVPFKRIIEESDAVGAKKGGGKAGSLKEFKGSERDIQSPLTSIVENTIELIKLAETNRPKVELVKLAESVEGQELIKRVKTPVEEIKVSREEVAKQLGISVEDADMVSTFRGVNRDLTPSQFAVFRDGKRQVFETTPELAEAISRLGGDGTSTNMAFKLMAGITTFKKFGITFTPDFIAKNMIRDSLTAGSFTKVKLNPMDVIGAIGDIWTKNDKYYSWLKSGGANGAFLEMGDRYVKTDILKLQKETNFLNSARNLVEKPIDIMRVAAELAEQSIRVAEYTKVRKTGGSVIEGGIASREITVDFQRVGAKVSALNSITAFMNVSIQGMDRTVRAIKEDPVGVTAKTLTYITAPTLLLYWANHDDERYKEIPRWQKDHFWIIPTDNWQDATAQEAGGLPDYMVQEKNGKYKVNRGTIYRIPKPQELGLIFASLPERALDAYFNDDPNAFKEFGKSMIGLITPSFVPDAVAPAIEQYFNKSFFTGRDIIPHHLQDILPEYQFVEYTSETAKTLGKMIATVDQTSDFASPLVLQNYIQSWGGSLGQYAVQAADKALIATGVAPDKVAPASTLSDLPFIKSFVVRFPTAGSNSVQDFNDAYAENKMVTDTIRYLAKQRNFDAMEKEMQLDRNQDNLVTLNGLKEALSTQSNAIRLISANPEMSPDEKRQMIDGLYLQMTESAKVGNAIMTEIKKSIGEK